MYALSPVLTHWSPSPVASISRFRHLYLYPYRCTRLGLGLYHPFYPRSPGECGLLRARWRRQQTPCIVVTLGGEYRRRFRYLAGVPGGAATRVLALSLSARTRGNRPEHRKAPRPAASRRLGLCLASLLVCLPSPRTPSDDLHASADDLGGQDATEGSINGAWLLSCRTLRVCAF